MMVLNGIYCFKINVYYGKILTRTGPAWDWGVGGGGGGQGGEMTLCMHM
jgi:hypothetical protein